MTMDIVHGIACQGHLIRDTFRQSRASGILWIMLGVTAVCVALCLSVKITGDVSLHDPDETVYFLPKPPPPGVLPPDQAGKGRRGLQPDPERAQRDGVETVKGSMSLAFGAVSIPLGRERKDAVHFLELLLAGGVAGALGLLLALVWTAGFVPAFLDPGTASVLLAKPLSRGQLLAGKYGGVLAFVGFQLLVFVGLTWLALGFRTGIWDATYWWCVPLLLIHFAAFYSFSVLLAVMTRNVAACVFGSVLFWLLGWGINYGWTVARPSPEQPLIPASTSALAETAYWISPKPIDAGLILFNTLNAQEHFEKPAVFKALESSDHYSPRGSLLSCALLASVLLSLAIHEFNEMDY